MESPTNRAYPPPTFVSAFDELKRSSSKLIEAYVAAGTTEVLGASRTVILAKFSAIALLALAIGFSTYGIAFELADLAVNAAVPDAAPEVGRLLSHLLVLVLAAIAAFVALKTKSAKVR